MNKQKKPNLVKRIFNKIEGTAAKTADGVKQGVQALVAKKEEADWNARLKKYNPLFPEEYTSEEFHLPNVIRIVDDAERRGIDVCEGAIGWRSKEKEIEVLHLYDEAVAFSGLRFLPIPVCNKVYTVHSYNRNVFIAVDEYEKIVQQEKLAELQELAFCLGVKRYWVELEEEDKVQASVGFNLNESVDVGMGTTIKAVGREKSQGKAFLVCKGRRKPQPPSLCWLKEDKNVEYLIKQRCSRAGKKMRMHTLVLCNTTNTLYSSVIGVALKFGMNIGAERKSTKNQNMIVRLEF